MRIEMLPVGMSAPQGCDFIRIERNGDGTVRLSGLVHVDRSALNRVEIYSSEVEAEQAGTAWAEHHGSERIYVERPQD